MNDFEMDFWGDCGNTWHEEQKQFAYAKRMGLIPIWDGAHPPTFDLGGRSVVDIGGGPVSLLLKTVNRGRVVVIDPGTFPRWVQRRYDECGIEYKRIAGEDIGSGNFDEAWIYNVLQHTNDPARVVANARKISDTIRIFEWVDLPPYEGHPHTLTEEDLNSWLDGTGFVSQLAENGAVGKAFYGVFASRSDS